MSNDTTQQEEHIRELIRELVAAERNQHIQIEELQREIDHLKNEQQKSSAITKLREEDITQRDKRASQMTLEIEALRRDAETSKSVLSEYKRRITDTEGSARQLQQEVNVYEDDNKRLTNEVVIARKRISEHQRDIAELMRDNTALKNEVSEFQASKQRHTDEINNLKATLNNLKGLVSCQQDLLTSSKQQATELQEETNMLKIENTWLLPNKPLVQPDSALSIIMRTSFWQAGSHTRHRIPVCCTKNISDFANIVEILNQAATPYQDFKFQTQKYDSMLDGGPERLAVVLAGCDKDCDHVDSVDKELADALRSKKGCVRVLMIVLRSACYASATSLYSSVKNEYLLFQLIHLRGKVLDDKLTKSTISRIMDFAKVAIQNTSL